MYPAVFLMLMSELCLVSLKENSTVWLISVYQSLTINPLFFQILMREAVLEPNPFTLCCVTNHLPFPESRDKAKMDTCAYSAEQCLLFLCVVYIKYLENLFQRTIFSPCKHFKKDYFQGSSVLEKINIENPVMRENPMVKS